MCIFVTTFHSVDFQAAPMAKDEGKIAGHLHATKRILCTNTLCNVAIATACPRSFKIKIKLGL